MFLTEELAEKNRQKYHYCYEPPKDIYTLESSTKIYSIEISNYTYENMDMQLNIYCFRH